MFYFIAIIFIVAIFLLFTGSIKINYISPEEMREIKDFLSNLIEGDRITTYKFNDSNAMSNKYTRIYTVKHDDPEKEEIYLHEGSVYTSPFIVKYKSFEFKNVVKKNGDVVLNIIERNKKDKDV